MRRSQKTRYLGVLQSQFTNYFHKNHNVMRYIGLQLIRKLDRCRSMRKRRADVVRRFRDYCSRQASVSFGKWDIYRMRHWFVVFDFEWARSFWLYAIHSLWLQMNLQIGCYAGRCSNVCNVHHADHDITDDWLSKMKKRDCIEFIKYWKCKLKFFFLYRPRGVDPAPLKLN